jgi:hypothetical protein
MTTTSRPLRHRAVGSPVSSPALVLGRSGDVLCWNRMAHALLAAHIDFDAPAQAGGRPNVARLVFLDPHTRELYADWREKARDTVADLRMTAARYPDDPRFTELVGELTLHSPEFASLWAAHPVRPCVQYIRNFHHPLVGALTLANELLDLPHDEGQRVALFNAEPGSPSHAALHLLSDLNPAHRGPGGAAPGPQACSHPPNAHA